jgi:hypothetical protein
MFQRCFHTSTETAQATVNGLANFNGKQSPVLHSISSSTCGDPTDAGFEHKKSKNYAVAS